jgi:3-phosphoshikimate 1-carboxyvinyltransferase
VSAADSYLVRPASAVRGTLTVPGDKSISHRALILGAIATGTTRVDGFLAGEDCLATLAALRSLGVRIEQPAATSVLVHGVGRDGLQAGAGPLDMGNAGTAMRLFAGLLAGQRFDSTLIGDASLMRRPMERVAAPLRLMGANISTEDGHAPVRLRGAAGLHGIDYALPVASAQIKSAILLAGLHASGTTRISEGAPTRDHTERMLGSFGARVERQGSTVSLTGGQTLHSCDLKVPGDFSSAAFFLVAGAIGATAGLTICNVGMNPTRTGLLDLLQRMGADIRIEALPSDGAEPAANLTVRAAPLHGIRVPPEMVSLAIDEFPAFFIAAAAATGETVVTGAAELRVKESDRLAVMAEGLSALGIHCELLSDGLRLQGGAMHGGVVQSHADHRIAMAFAIASLRASAPIRIEAVANVATSFPGFAATARHIGLDLVD